MLTIDELAYRSKLLKTAPKAKMLFGAIPLVLCLAFSANMVSIVTIVVMGAVSVIAGGVCVRRYAGMLMWPLGFLLIGTLTIVFTRTGGEAAYFSINVFGEAYGVTATSAKFGGTLILKAIGAVSCLYFIALNTPMTDILEALRSMKVPILLISLMELIYRYIFVLLDESRRMKAAQDSRLGYVNIGVGLRSVGQLAGELFIRAYMRADRVYNALRARGYEGEFRSVAREFPPARGMYAGCAALAVLLSAVWLLERALL